MDKQTNYFNSMKKMQPKDVLSIFLPVLCFLPISYLVCFHLLSLSLSLSLSAATPPRFSKQ